MFISINTWILGTGHKKRGKQYVLFYSDLKVGNACDCSLDLLAISNMMIMIVATVGFLRYPQTCPRPKKTKDILRLPSKRTNFCKPSVNKEKLRLFFVVCVWSFSTGGVNIAEPRS